MNGLVCGMNAVVEAHHVLVERVSMAVNERKAACGGFIRRRCEPSDRPPLKEPGSQLVWRRTRGDESIGIDTLAKDMGFPSGGGRTHGMLPNENGDATETGHAPRDHGDPALFRWHART